MNITEASPTAADSIGSLTSLAAHDIRSPLGALATWVDLMHDAATPAARDHAAGMVREQIAAIDRIAADLVLAGRVLDGTLELTTMTVDLTVTLRAAIEGWLSIAERRALEVEIRIPPDRIAITADPQLLHHALQRFAGYAITQWRAPGACCLTIESQDSGATVGIEWPPGRMAQVGSLADCLRSRGDRADAPPALSLAVAWEIVALHGGRVVLPTEGPGARVSILFPASAG